VTFFISKDQACIKRNPFQVCRFSEGKSKEVMKKLSEKDLQHCFQQCKILNTKIGVCATFQPYVHKKWLWNSHYT
jgi:hypothetical protein